MVTRTLQRTIDTMDQLRSIIESPAPDALSILKEKDYLDEHCQAFIAQSPFLLLATASRDGRCDISPRGDAPGFVLVLDERTVVLPDRPGNRRLDSMENMIDNPHAALIFLVPTMEETLRVQGRATIVEDDDLLAQMAVRGKAPRLGIVIETEEVYFQCAKALKRSKLWDPASWIDREQLPSFARILADQVKQPDRSVEVIDEQLKASAERLY